MFPFSRKLQLDIGVGLVALVVLQCCIGHANGQSCVAGVVQSDIQTCMRTYLNEVTNDNLCSATNRYLSCLRDVVATCSEEAARQFMDTAINTLRNSGTAVKDCVFDSSPRNAAKYKTPSKLLMLAAALLGSAIFLSKGALV